MAYNLVGALNPRRSVFNNSYTKLFDCDMGKLIPVMCDEAIPGDNTSISMEAVIRFQPLLAPILHEVYMHTYYFFVPTRLLMNRDTVEDLGDSGEWEDFITGGQDGLDDTSLPVWGSTRLPDNSNPFPYPVGGYAKYSLWDYFGLPIGVNPLPESMPLSFNKRAYNLVYNEYFRDQDLMDEVSLDSDLVQNVCWKKDRFTSALYDTQRGDRPAIPLQGLTSVQFNGAVTGDSQQTLAPIGMFEAFGGAKFLTNAKKNIDVGSTATQINVQTGNVLLDNSRSLWFKDWLNNNSLNMSQAVTFDTVDMRRLFQYQKYLERNMRSGARYTEQLRARFGVMPQDSRLQRPEFIGSTRSPIIVSEVLQTSESSDGSKQGNMAGHGISASKTSVGRVRVLEHGYIIGVMCIRPKPVYYQGINRQWTRRTRYDFATPELVNLSEVAIRNDELVVTGGARDITPFGFQGIYDEYRVKESMVCGDMRDTLSYWNLHRTDYDSANPPSLNANFVRCEPSKRIFAVQSVPGIIVHYANIVRNVRPLPVIAEPGLIDHH